MTRDASLTTVLRKARDLFQEYGDNHMAKEPPQRGKALRNYLMVDEINRALLAEDFPASDVTLFERMAAKTAERADQSKVD